MTFIGVFVAFTLLILLEKHFYKFSGASVPQTNKDLNSEKTNALYLIFSLCFASFAFRLINESYFYPWVFHMYCFLSLVPMALKLIFSRRYLNTEFSLAVNIKKLIFSMLMVLIIPEILVFVYLSNLKYKNILTNIPVPGLGDTDEKLYTQMMLINVVMLSLGSFFVENYFEVFFSLYAGILSVYYFLPGLEKLKYDWHTTNNLHFLLKASKFQLNWRVNFINKDVFIQLLPICSLLVLLTELLAPVLLFPFFVQNKLFLIGFLVCLCSFHFFVFLSSGIFFWKWIYTIFVSLLNLYLVDVLTYSSNSVFSFIFVCGFLYSFFISKMPIRLGWLDSPLYQVYKIYFKLTDNDKLFRLRPHDIFPWDTLLSQNRLLFLTPTVKNVSGCLGAVRNKEYYNFLLNVSKGFKKEEEIKKIIQNFIVQEGRHYNNDQVCSNITRNFISFIISIINIKLSRQNKLYNFFHWLMLHIRDMKEENENYIDDIACVGKNTKIEKIVITFQSAFYSEVLKKEIILKEHNIEIQI